MSKKREHTMTERCYKNHKLFLEGLGEPFQNKRTYDFIRGFFRELGARISGCRARFARPRDALSGFAACTSPSFRPNGPGPGRGLCNGHATGGYFALFFEMSSAPHAARTA